MPAAVGSVVLLDRKHAAMRSAVVCRYRGAEDVWLFDTTWKEGASRPVTRRAGFTFDGLGIYRTTRECLRTWAVSITPPVYLETGSSTVPIFGLFDYVIVRDLLGVGARESAVFHYDASANPERATSHGLFVEGMDGEEVFMPTRVYAVLPKVYDVPADDDDDDGDDDDTVRAFVQEYASDVAYRILMPGAQLRIPSLGDVFCLYNGDAPLRFPEDRILAQMCMGAERAAWLEEDCVPRGTMIVAESGRVPPKKHKLACATLFSVYGMDRLQKMCRADRWWIATLLDPAVYCACPGVPRVYRIVADLVSLARYRLENEEGGAALVMKSIVDSVFRKFASREEAMAYGCRGVAPREKTVMYRWVSSA